MARAKRRRLLGFFSLQGFYSVIKSLTYILPIIFKNPLSLCRIVMFCKQYLFNAFCNLIWGYPFCLKRYVLDIFKYGKRSCENWTKRQKSKSCCCTWTLLGILRLEIVPLVSLSQNKGRKFRLLRNSESFEKLIKEKMIKIELDLFLCCLLTNIKEEEVWRRSKC